MALGDADIMEPVIPQQPREFRPPAASGDAAALSAQQKLRVVQSRWNHDAQRQWYQVRTPFQWLSLTSVCVSRL